MAATNKTAKKPSKPRKPKALAPKTDPPDPEKSVQPIYLTVRQTGGVRVNEDTALTLTSVWACLRVVSQAMPGLEWSVVLKRDDGGRDPRPRHHVNWLLNEEASEEMPAFQFRETIVIHAMSWGNGYAEIERNLVGDAVALWLLTPDRVELERINGDLFYRVENDYGEPTYLRPRDMFHLRGPGYNGLEGYNTIRMFARAIGLGISLEDSASMFLGNDSTPGGILETDKTLTDPARQTLLESWNRRHLGPSNRRNVAVLEGGLKWKQTGTAPEDTQLVQQRQLTPADICRIYGVPPHKIADLTRSTNNNIEHQELEFVEGTLRPWAERLETEANVKLFGRNSRGKYETIIALDELKRGDMNARKEFHSAMLDRGVFSINDVLKRENMNPIGPDGDKRFVPLNMQLLENAGEEPKTLPQPPAIEPEPTQNDEEPPDTQEDRLSRLSGGCLAVLQDACRRCIKQRSDARKLEGKALERWLGRHRDYCRESLSPGVLMLATIYCKEPESPAKVALAAYVEALIADQSEELDYTQQAEKLRTMVIAACAAVGGSK